MSARGIRYIVVGGTVPRNFRHGEQALHHLERIEGGGLIIIGSANRDNATLTRSPGLDALRAEMDSTRMQLGLLNEDMTDIYIPIPGLQSDEGKPGLGIVRFTTVANVLGIYLVADPVNPAIAWPADFVPISATSAFSIALRESGRKRIGFTDISSSIVGEFESIVEMQAALEQQALYEALSAQMRGGVNPEINDTLLRVMETRNRYSRLLSALYLYRPFSIRVEMAIRRALAELDALIGSQSALLLSQLYRATEIAKREEARVEGEVKAADARLAKVVSALVLPTLWLSFLGTNVLPGHLFEVEIPSSAATMIALGGTGLTGLIGWFVVGWLFRGSRVKHRD